MGKLPIGFDYKPLLKLIDHESEKVRVLAIKNLAKLSDKNLLKLFRNILNVDECTDVRRETVSAIGRMRDKKTINDFVVWAFHLLCKGGNLIMDNSPNNCI